MKQKNNFVLAIHGGATDKRGLVKLQQPRMDTLTLALQKGYDVLHAGGGSLAAVEVAVMVLEDSGLFDAGKGGDLTADGRVELDAAIMDGQTQRAGSVACVTTIKNPIQAARYVMQKTPSVMLAARGAEEFAKHHKLAQVKPSYYINTKEKRVTHNTEGTVGAVARDHKGNLAAATSTGGIALTRWQRVGDSPIIGAGTYAHNKSCAISATGKGEYFMRSVFAYHVATLIRYKKYPLAKAMDVALKEVAHLGGCGGAIGVDHRGQVAWLFNTRYLYRGKIDSVGRIELGVA